MAKLNGLYPGEGYSPNKVRFVATGEFREPKAGEYYLSGAIVQAYIAHNNLSQAYWIAQPVAVKRIPETFVV